MPTGKETVNYWAFLRAFEWREWAACSASLGHVLQLGRLESLVLLRCGSHSPAIAWPGLARC